MTVFGIVAVSQDGVIGVNNGLPWRLPFDLKWFKMNTYKQAIVMGRKTWESLPRKPLPGRVNYVISTKPKPMDTRAEWHNHIHTALQSAKSKHTHTFIIGGGDIFKQCSKYIHVYLITQVHRNVLASGSLRPQQGKESITTFEAIASSHRIWKSPVMKENGMQFHFEMWKTRKIQTQRILQTLHKYGL
tara:strand:+ start:619 stop:1182 length:564 start_codon:yes stop_codon:yes gene_type:complete